MAKAL
jgi:hypothetical protein